MLQCICMGVMANFFGDKPIAVAMTNAVVLNHLPNSGD